MYERIIGLCERAGFRPLVSAETADVMSLVPLVAGGFGVSFLPRSLAEIGVQGMVSVPLAGEGLSVPVKLAFLHSSTSAVVLDFVAIARRVAGLETQSIDLRTACVGQR
jgi:DNA-binding transcriptional LysR family regulator